ncbi:hypothetical protein HK104_003764 [Borealophlyctis nickersoniae]|nr:hypothetical protein HK104_003764 [Borealophlyctis nickersoniae]
MPSHYEILQVSPTASEDDIKKRYQRLVLLLHPDKQKQHTSDADPPSSKEFQDVVDAWEVLRNPRKRREYDEFLGMDGVDVDFWSIS